MLVDASYLTFKTGFYASAKSTIRHWAEKDARFYLDGRRNVRSERHPWYKANRLTLDPRTAELKVLAKELQRWMAVEFPSQCFQEDGAEGDDLIAMAVLGGESDMVVAEDKDYLQLPAAWLWTLTGDPWGVERLHKKTKLPLAQGRKFVAWQLLYGDLADNIPRRLATKDLYTGPYVFSTPDPLLTAIEMLPENRVRESLDCLLMPSPLLTGLDSISQALSLPF